MVKVAIGLPIEQVCWSKNLEVRKKQLSVLKISDIVGGDNLSITCDRQFY